VGVGESGKALFTGASTRQCLALQKLTRRLFVCDKKIFLNQWLGGLLRCMMTSPQFVGMMRPLHQKKSVAGRARGDPNPPHASVAGLIFCPGMKRSNGFLCIKRQLFVWKNKKLSFIHKIYIWHHNSKADAAESG